MCVHFLLSVAEFNFQFKIFSLCRYGFNSHGHAVVKDRLRGWKQAKERPSLQHKLLGVNLGKNKSSPSPEQDYVRGVRELGASADYVVINVSSPNTPGLRDMQGRQALETLLDKVITPLLYYNNS